MATVDINTRSGTNTEGLQYAVTGTDVSTKRALDVYVQGGEVVAAGGLLDGITYDYVGVTYPSGTQEVYKFRVGGSGGTLVATVTVDYTDATKVSLSAVTKT